MSEKNEELVSLTCHVCKQALPPCQKLTLPVCEYYLCKTCSPSFHPPRQQKPRCIWECVQVMVDVDIPEFFRGWKERPLSFGDAMTLVEMEDHRAEALKKPGVDPELKQ